MSIDKEVEEIDPDEVLEVREEVAAILRKSAKDRKAGKLETVYFEEALSI